MTSVALLFVGAVLLINGLTFCGILGGRAGVPVNLLVGMLLLFATAACIVDAGGTAGKDRMPLYSAVGFTLFGFTYLGVAGQTLLRTDGRSLGVYCGWATIIAVVLATVNMPDSAGMGWLWLAWAVLFLSFALALLTGSPRLTKSAGILSVFLGVSSTTLPGLLMVDGSWSSIPVWLIATAQILGVTVYIAVLLGSLESAQPSAPTAHTPAPASADISD